MSTPIVNAGLSEGFTRAWMSLGRLWQSSAALVARMDAVLAARARAAKDRRDLAGMSDRELADIGLPRSSVDSAADGAWQRDWPR